MRRMDAGVTRSPEHVMGEGEEDGAWGHAKKDLGDDTNTNVLLSEQG